MRKRSFYGIAIAGTVAGVVNGLFGAGGGMILIPLLTMLTDLSDDEIFSSSLAIMLPICVISLGVSFFSQSIPIMEALPYLIGSAAGGDASAHWGRRIPTIWLHRLLGILILWGGIRYLC